MIQKQGLDSPGPNGPGPGVTERWMDFDGARMRYLQAGSGPALILLHGLMGYSFSWRYTMPALAPYRTVYAPDLLGAGFSDRPLGIDHSVRGTALRILRFVEQLGLTSFDLLGTSRGGIVATAVAAECLAGAAASSELLCDSSRSEESRSLQPRAETQVPHFVRDDNSGKSEQGKSSKREQYKSSNGADYPAARVRKLVLVCPVNPYSAHGRWLAPFFGTRLGAAAFRFAIERRPSLYPYFHARLFADRDKIPAGSLDGYRAPLAIPGLFEHALSIVQTWKQDLRQQEELLPKLAEIPTLLMWGDKDPAVYVSSMERLARHFFYAQMVIFPGIGHLPYEECPQEFNQALIKFLIP